MSAHPHQNHPLLPETPPDAARQRRPRQWGRLAGLLLLLAGGISGSAGLAEAAGKDAGQSALAVLDAPVEYSAEYSLISSAQGRYNGTVSHMPGRERRDFNTAMGSQALLIRRDNNFAAILWPQRKFYLSTTVHALSAMAGGLEEMTLRKRNPVADKVADQPATRYDVTGTSPDGGGFSGKIWLTGDDIVVRLSGKTRYRGADTSVEMSLSHLRRGPVNPGLFELGSDWQGLPLPGGQ